MSTPEMFEAPLDAPTIRRLADDEFGDMIKFVVDLDRKVICAGGGLHADEEQILLNHGSAQRALWGANYYPDLPPAERIVYRSMINIRPADGNTQQIIQSEDIRQSVRELALHYFEGKPL
jgi:hypothetical protein